MQNENNAVEIFKNEEFGEIRTVIIDNEPWFVVADVCTYFGVTNRNRIMQSVDDEDKGGTQMTTPGGTQNIAIVSESGLYSLLFALQPTKARGVSDEYIEERQIKLRNFRHWITHEVIPSIRKHGAYMTPQKLYECLQDPRAIANILNALADEQDKNKELTNENAALNATIEEQQPKVEFADHVLEARNAIDMSDFSKMICKNGIMLGRNNLFKKLRQLNILMDTNIPYQRYIDNGWFVVVEFTYHQGNTPYVGAKTLVTGKGQIALVKRLHKAIEEEKALIAEA